MKYLLKPVLLAAACLLLAVSNLFAQSEQLLPLTSNPAIKKYLLSNPAPALRNASVTNLDLPFVDDFSSAKVYPDANKWSDNYVYVNDQYARNPITIGVATFDGLDANGNAYTNANAAAQGGCDTLTSQPINLLTKPASVGGGNYVLGDSLTLSFYYEKKGWGDAPEANDSLILDFYNPATSTWSRQWNVLGGVSGGQDSLFVSVNLRITNLAFLQDGFRFRFRTYGANTGILDIWHLDYVRLYAAYNSFSGTMDTVLRDVAFTRPGISLLDGFTSIPWDHFTSLSATAQQAIISDSSTVYYRVNDNAAADVGFNNRIYDYAGSLVSSFGLTNGNIFPARPNNQNLTYTFPLTSIYPNSPSYTIDSTTFLVKNYFSNANSFLGLTSNDTISYTQEFYNYYSYDDGNAEVAYDLVSAPNGKLAMRFDIIKPDTLRAVRFYFAQMGASVATKLFTIKIWSSLSPETLIYQETNQRPSYIDEVNGYSTYVLDQIVPVSGTIYVGFQQVAGDGLHLGFDKNTASNSKMFYNVTGTWNGVGVATGSFMIRPVMGDTNLFVGISHNEADFQFAVYPNPAAGLLKVKVAEPFKVSAMEVYSCEGNVVKNLKGFNDVIAVDDLSNGIYLLRMVLTNGNVVQKKFIVAH